MNNNDLVSVIVPVYKVEKFLRDCLDSIINQTYKNLEIILVDDGSPDNCGAICDEYALKDSRITVYHKENGGLSDARNYALDRCNGDYVTFVDSDDAIRNDFVATLLDLIKESGSDVAASSVLKIAENTQFTQGGGGVFGLESGKLIIIVFLGFILSGAFRGIMSAGRKTPLKFCSQVKFFDV